MKKYDKLNQQVGQKNVGQNCGSIFNSIRDQS